MISLRRNSKTHTVSPNPDRFCGVDRSQEIEIAIDALEIIDVTLHSNVRAPCQDVAQPVAHIFPNLDTVSMQCAATGREMPPKRQKNTADCQHLYRCGSLSQGDRDTCKQVRHCTTMNNLGYCRFHVVQAGTSGTVRSWSGTKTSNPPHHQTCKQNATSPSSRQSMSPETVMKTRGHDLRDSRPQPAT